MTYRFMTKYMGFTEEELRILESLVSEEEKCDFRQSHPHSLNFEVVIETILNFLLKALQALKGTQTDEIEHYAQLELQMLTTKLLAFNVLLKKWGVYNVEKDITLNPIVDPIVLGGLVRNIYETLGVFRLVYLLPDDDEKKRIAFDLWKRHSFLDNIKELGPTITFNEKKGYDASRLREQLQYAEAQRDNILADIQATTYAKNHSHFDFDRGNAKKSLIILDENPRFVSLSGIDREMEYYMPLKNVVFKDMYSILSHYAHPSYKAEDQFDNEFRGTGNNSEGPYHMIVSAAAILSVCFISSYMVYDNAIQSELNEEELEVFNAVYESFCIGKFGKDPSMEEYTQERSMTESV